MSKKQKAFYLRAFLNQEGWHSSGHVIMEVPRVDPTKKWTSDPTLTIADCSRIIDLSLGWDSEDEIENSHHKLDLLVDSLIKFRRHFRREAAKALKVIENRKKKRKKLGQ